MSRRQKKGVSISWQGLWKDSKWLLRNCLCWRQRNTVSRAVIHSLRWDLCSTRHFLCRESVLVLHKALPAASTISPRHQLIFSATTKVWFFCQVWLQYFTHKHQLSPSPLLPLTHQGCHRSTTAKNIYLNTEWQSWMEMAKIHIWFDIKESLKSYLLKINA